MKRRRRLGFFVLASLLVSSLALAGKTRRYSVVVNRPEVRQHISRNLFDGRKLRLGAEVDLKNPPPGITREAAKKAVQTLSGFERFNSGLSGGNHVVSAGRNGQRWVVTQVRSSSGLGVSYSSRPVEHFVARTGRRGIVVARGFVQRGQITWTRSHNERGKDTPSERAGR